jgi:hypothetical protein
MSLLYIYCISRGIHTNELYMKNPSVSKTNRIDIIPFKDIQVAVSFVDYEEFNEKKLTEQLNDLAWVEEKAFAHENTIEEIMEKYPVIPMQFCTLYKTKENLMEFLEDYHEQIKCDLSFAAVNQEWGIKIYCDVDLLKGSISEKQNFKDELETINKKPPGIAFMLKKKFREKIENCIQETINADVQDIYEEINTTLENVILKEIQDSEILGKKIVLHMAALLNINKYKAFSKIIDELIEKHKDNGYKIKIDGPWPIYHFITFTMIA